MEAQSDQHTDHSDDVTDLEQGVGLLSDCWDRADDDEDQSAPCYRAPDVETFAHRVGQCTCRRESVHCGTQSVL